MVSIARMRHVPSIEGRREARGGGMAGITSIGAYIPMYRLSGEEIRKMWWA
jgi:hypothetical protein